MVNVDMINQIKEAISETGEHVSFVELMNFFGDAAKGDKAIYLTSIKNVVLWVDVSQEFADGIAYCVANDIITPTPAQEIIYAIDGTFVPTPVIKGEIRKEGYSEPHWLPVVFNKGPNFNEKILI